MGEGAESEADSFDPLDEVVDGFGGAVAHERLVQGGDVGLPAFYGPFEGADLDGVFGVFGGPRRAGRRTRWLVLGR